MAGWVLVQGNDEQPTDPGIANMTTPPGHVSPLYPSNTRTSGWMRGGFRLVHLYIYTAFSDPDLGVWRNRGNLLLSFPNVGDCMYTRDQSISTISSVSSGFSIHQLLVLGFVSRKNISLAIIKFYFIVLPASAASTDASHTHTCISPLRRSRLVA